MAKKKTSKKSSVNLSLILKVAVIVLGVAAFCMAFVACIRFVNSDGDLHKSFTGFQEMFGYGETVEEYGISVTTNYLAFSFMTLLTFVLPLVGAILTLLNNKIVKFVGVGLMIVGGVLMFFVPSFVVLASGETLSATAIAVAVLENCTVKLGVGAILGGVFSILGGAVAGYSLLKK